MKSFLVSLLCCLMGASATYASCPHDADVQYAIAALALIKGNGTDLLGASQNVTSEALCENLLSSSVLQSQVEGYRQVVLNFELQTCSLQLKPAGNGKYSDVYLESCEK